MQIARASKFDQARYAYDELWSSSGEFVWDQYIAKEELIRYAVLVVSNLDMLTNLICKNLYFHISCRFILRHLQQRAV